MIEKWVATVEGLRSTDVRAFHECTVNIRNPKHFALSYASRFQLNQADGCVRVGRQPHESMHPTCKQWTVQAGGGSMRLNGYVNKQNYRIWSEANPQVYVETPLHPEKLTVVCALWAGGPLLQKR
ncbi:hypothetical protein TNCV_506731 [Trichonephila clavipes]|nr:hypothetical protein TNCV_506731 [Trichonephila clavipes]